MVRFSIGVAANPSDRKNFPVFVMGCHRSGTNLLYDMLLSAGGFAIYRGYLPVYKVLIPRYGAMRAAPSAKKSVATWLRSKGFRRTGLAPEQLSNRILNDCQTGGDFIRVVMDSVAQHQNVGRWAVYDPDNVLHSERIKKDIPNALFVHIIRDGRDIALSLKKMGGFAPLPWDRSETNSLVATALYWEWMVRHGRAAGRRFPPITSKSATKTWSPIRAKLLPRWAASLATISITIRFSAPVLGVSPKLILPFAKRKAKQRSIRLAAGNNASRRRASRPSKAQSATVSKRTVTSFRSRQLNIAAVCASRGCARFFPAFLGSKLWLKINTPVGRFANVSALELAEDPRQLPIRPAPENRL